MPNKYNILGINNRVKLRINLSNLCSILVVLTEVIKGTISSHNLIHFVANNILWKVTNELFPQGNLNDFID